MAKKEKAAQKKPTATEIASVGLGKGMTIRETTVHGLEVVLGMSRDKAESVFRVVCSIRSAMSRIRRTAQKVTTAADANVKKPKTTKTKKSNRQPV